MAIVVVLVLLIGLGVGIAVAVSGNNKKQQASRSGTTSVVSPTRPTFSQPSSPSAASPSADAHTAAARATESGSAISPSAGLPHLGYEASSPAGPPASAPDSNRPALAEASTPPEVDSAEVDDDEVDEDLSNRFNPRGERSTRSDTYRPTVPRKPVLLPVVDLDDDGPGDAPDHGALDRDASASDDAQAPAPEAAQPAVEGVDGTSSLEDDLVADVVAASTEAIESAGGKVIIDLDDSASEEAVIVIDDGPQPLDEVEANETDNDNVLKALIGRVRVTPDDVDAVASELGRRDDLDAEGVAEVLADLAEIAEAAAAEREEELTLFSEEVPSRPGQLTRFAELEATERRRVIIRVLCLLVARAAEDESGEDGPSDSTSPSRSGWPGDSGDDDADLPNRVSLVRS